MTDLDYIDDMLCNIYSGQDESWIYREMTDKGRERMRKSIMHIIEELRDWREVNGK